MNEEMSLHDLFDKSIKIAVEAKGNYFPRRSLLAVRRCNKTLKALVDPKLSTLTVPGGSIETFLGCLLTPTVVNLETYIELEDVGRYVFRNFLTTAMPKLRNLYIRAGDWNEVAEFDMTESTIGWTGLTSLEISNFKGRTLPNWISQLENLKRLILGRRRKDFTTGNFLCPHWISNLKSLKELELCVKVSVSDLCSLVGCLVHLTKLNFPYFEQQQQGALPPSLFSKLSNLQSLDLSGFGQVSLEINNLKELTSLTLGQGPKQVRPSTSQAEHRPLPKLQVLDITVDGYFLSGGLFEWVEKMVDLRKLILKYSRYGGSFEDEFTDQSSITPLFLRNLQKLTALSIDTPGKYGLKYIWEVPNWIGDLKNLQSLELVGYGNNSLRAAIIPDSIGKLTNLTQLRLKRDQENLLNCISPEGLASIIGNLTALVDLELSCNELPWEIGNLKSLRTLSLNNCPHLVKIPDSVGNLIKLEQLKLSCCKKLENIPDSVGKLSALTGLDLYACGSLTTLPNSISKLTGIETLSIMSCDSLEALPESFGYMNISNVHISRLKCLQRLPESLGYMNISNLRIESLNCLQSLPRSFGNMKLETLELSGCGNLRTLPDSLSSLSTLEELTIKDCTMLQKLPSNIMNLPQLRELKINGCHKLNVLPASMTSLTALRNLKLELHNTILNEGIFSNCPLLTTLNLSWVSEYELLRINGKLLRINGKLPESLGSLVGLQRLSLSNSNSNCLPESLGNLIRLRNLEIDECGFLEKLPNSIGNLAALRTVSLSSCSSLTCLPKEFCDLKSLEGLDISNCARLTHLPAELGKLSNLRTLSIVGLNTLASLPESIGQLSFLEKLELRRNWKLQCLPESISQCTSLHNLTLRSCSSLNALPKDMSPLQRLRELILICCSSLETYPESLGGLSMLKFLRVEEDSPLRKSSVFSELKSYGVCIHYEESDDEDWYLN